MYCLHEEKKYISVNKWKCYSYSQIFYVILNWTFKKMSIK